MLTRITWTCGSWDGAIFKSPMDKLSRGLHVLSAGSVAVVGVGVCIDVM